jgi:uncharacterized peroxidase-related enzyme
MANIKVIGYDEAEGPLKSIYDDIISKRGKLADVHQIQSLNPATIIAHMDLYMSVMFSHSPLSRAIRETIAVVVSKANQCDYCMAHHSAALNHYWKNDERIRSLISNYRNAELTEEEVLLCDYAWKLTTDPASFESPHFVFKMKTAGVTDREILDATLVISYFNFVNRLVVALGVSLEENSGGYHY